MRYLLDTQILLWSASAPERLSASSRRMLTHSRNELIFSAASLWEVTIKSSLGRQDFRVDATLLRQGLLENGYSELPISGLHAIAVDALPPLHRDPFDRLLLAQAIVEGLTLLTADERLASYPGPVRRV